MGGEELEHNVIRQAANTKAAGKNLFNRNRFVCKKGGKVALSDRPDKSAQHGQANAKQRAVGKNSACSKFAIALVSKAKKLVLVGLVVGGGPGKILEIHRGIIAQKY